jgi:hypothetical protein
MVPPCWLRARQARRRCRRPAGALAIPPTGNQQSRLQHGRRSTGQLRSSLLPETVGDDPPSWPTSPHLPSSASPCRRATPNSKSRNGHEPARLSGATFRVKGQCDGRSKPCAGTDTAADERWLISHGDAPAAHGVCPALIDQDRDSVRRGTARNAVLLGERAVARQRAAVSRRS